MTPEQIAARPMPADTKQVSDSGRRKPPAAGKGRPKGATNKLTRSIKEAIEAAFSDVGGAAYLAEQARTNPTAFMALLAKVLPTQLGSDPDNPLPTGFRVTLVDP